MHGWMDGLLVGWMHKPKKNIYTRLSSPSKLARHLHISVWYPRAEAGCLGAALAGACCRLGWPASIRSLPAQRNVEYLCHITHTWLMSSSDQWPLFDSQHHDITRCHIRPWLSWGFTELAFGGLMVNCDLLKSSTHLFTEAGTTQKKTKKKKHNLALLETYCICKNYAYHIDLHARCIAMRRDILELFWKFVFCLSSLEPAKYNLVSKFYGDNMWKIIWGALTSVLGFTEKIDPPIISTAPRLWFSIHVKISGQKELVVHVTKNNPTKTKPVYSNLQKTIRKPIDQFDNTSRKTPRQKQSRSCNMIQLNWPKLKVWVWQPNVRVDGFPKIDGWRSPAEHSQHRQPRSLI